MQLGEEDAAPETQPSSGDLADLSFGHISDDDDDMSLSPGAAAAGTGADSDRRGKLTGRDKILCEDSNSSILLQTPQNSIHRPTPPGNTMI